MSKTTPSSETAKTRSAPKPLRVLVVDNKSAHLLRLQALITDVLGEVVFRLRDPRAMVDSDMLWADLVVVSGGWGRSIAKNPLTFVRMVQYCVDHQKPTIGICLGAEAIAAYFGATLTEMPVRRVGNVRIFFEDGVHVAMGLQSSELVYEFHKWTVSGVQAPLVTLATSKDGPELYRHATLPLWAMQFHPEVQRGDSQGHAIFSYVIDQLGLGR
jgi:anthranilate/para-aminobenzoate synthase component II